MKDGGNLDTTKQTTAIYIVIELSLLLNYSLWIILAAPIGILTKWTRSNIFL